MYYRLIDFFPQTICYGERFWHSHYDIDHEKILKCKEKDFNITIGVHRNISFIKNIQLKKVWH